MTPGAQTTRSKRSPSQVVGLSILLLAISAHETQDGIKRDHCEQHTKNHTTSPDGTWVATVDEAFCQIAPIGGANILVLVELTRADSPFQPMRVLGVFDEDRPRVAWTAPDILQVIVSKRPLLDLIPRHLGQVQIDPKFEPRR